MRRLLALFLLWLAVGVAPALAHRINLFAYRDGDRVRGEVYFSDGSPARGVKVVLEDAAGHPLAETETSARGEFSFPLPAGVKEVRLVSQGEMGHRAEMTLVLQSGGSTPQSLPPSPPSPSAGGGASNLSSGDGLCPREEIALLVREEVRREVAPLKTMLQELVRSSREPRASQVIAGLGYIFGLFGLVFWLRSRR